jgi:hypothetical protein
LILVGIAELGSKFFCFRNFRRFWTTTYENAGSQKIIGPHKTRSSLPLSKIPATDAATHCYLQDQLVYAFATLPEQADSESCRHNKGIHVGPRSERRAIGLREELKLKMKETLGKTEFKARVLDVYRK